MARFLNNVVDIKNTEKVVGKITGEDGEDVEHVISKAFKSVDVSFKSISLCNLSTINALNDCKTSAVIR